MDTHERLIDAARFLIQTRGYNGFSYADVADVVKIRKPSIHHHFPAKSDLARAVVQQSHGAILAQIQSLAEGDFDAEARLRGYVGYWERCIVDYSAPFCVAGMLASEMPTLPPDLADDVRRHFRDLADWLEIVLAQGVKKGQFALSYAVPHEAEAFMALVYGAMLAARAYGDPAVFASIVEGALAKIVRSPAKTSSTKKTRPASTSRS